MLRELLGGGLCRSWCIFGVNCERVNLLCDRAHELHSHRSCTQTYAVLLRWPKLHFWNAEYFPNKCPLVAKKQKSLMKSSKDISKFQQNITSTQLTVDENCKATQSEQVNLLLATQCQLWETVVVQGTRKVSELHFLRCEKLPENVNTLPKMMAHLMLLKQVAWKRASFQANACKFWVAFSEKKKLSKVWNRWPKLRAHFGKKNGLPTIGLHLGKYFFQSFRMQILFGTPPEQRPNERNPQNNPQQQQTQRGSRFCWPRPLAKVSRPMHELGLTFTSGLLNPRCHAFFREPIWIAHEKNFGGR